MYFSMRLTRQPIRYDLFRTFENGVLRLDSGFGHETELITTGGPHAECTRNIDTTATCDSGGPRADPAASRRPGAAERRGHPQRPARCRGRRTVRRPALRALPRAPRHPRRRLIVNDLGAKRGARGWRMPSL